jgi:hypothetical protein
MGTPHIGMGRDMSIFQIGESPYQYGVHSNLGTNIYMYQTMYEYNVFLPLPNEKLITFVPSFIT